MDKGWKPLPVLLKIIMVILMFRVFSSVFSLSPSFEQGFDFCGYTFYGLYAINFLFIFKTLLPLVIVVCMIKRYRHTWIAAAAYFLCMSMSIFLSLWNSGVMLIRLQEQMPGMFNVPAGIDENDFQKMLNLSFKASIVFSALFEMTIMLMFIIKRKYFSEQENISSDEQLPS